MTHAQARHYRPAWSKTNGAAVLSLLLTTTSCRQRDAEVVVFHADSLIQVLDDAAEVFRKQNPGIRVRLEPSESQVAVRKVTELGMTADLVIVADAAMIQRMLTPQHASFALAIATNEIVVAHRDHSRFTDEISTANWLSVLLRPAVRLGRADPDTASIGYHTLLVWELAKRALEREPSANSDGLQSALLVDELRARCAAAHLVQDEAALVALLETTAIDYAFVYRSTAENHHLKITSLPPGINLSQWELAPEYETVAVEVGMRRGGDREQVRGAPISYGLTIPTGARQAPEAARFVRLLLSDHRFFERRGFRPAIPVRCSPCSSLPRDLGTLP